MELPRTLIEGTISRGTIFHSTLFADIDHGKFFVVIGVTDNYIVGFFFINSNINNSIKSKPDQFSMQYLMRKVDYPFLNYDSFLSATTIRYISKSKLSETIHQHVTTIVGYMQEEHMNELLESARASILFTPKQKELFFK